MANVLYDIDLDSFGVPAFGLTPYVGIGAGYQWSRLSPITTVSADNTVDRIRRHVKATSPTRASQASPTRCPASCPAST